MGHVVHVTHHMNHRRCAEALLLAFLLVSDAWWPTVDACGPGRGGGRRRRPRKLTPLVFQQHVPNVSENTLGASGLTEGRVTRDDPRFKELVPNYNTDIIFKDEEGTGADRLMTQRCKEKLNTLAISVMNQWPGVKLRVTEGWDEEGHHSPDSLHYEGRAVDITTSDRDRTKYGMLARLAVEAGFDWVYYESRSHIHCSVKSESSQAAKSGGCFDGNGTVITRTGEKRLISQLNIGDEVLTVDNSGALEYSEVLLFLDRDPNSRRLFYVIETESKQRITMTHSHLLYVVTTSSNERPLVVTTSTSTSNSMTSVTSTSKPDVIDQAKMVATFAMNVIPGNYLYTVDNVNDKYVRVHRVTSVRSDWRTGVYAPLTSRGNIVVGDIVASCYAVFDDQTLAHLSFLPVRLYDNARHFFVRLLQKFNVLRLTNDNGDDRSETNQVVRPVGIHWYAKLLYKIAQVFLPSKMVY